LSRSSEKPPCQTLEIAFVPLNDNRSAKQTKERKSCMVEFIFSLLQPTQPLPLAIIFRPQAVLEAAGRVRACLYLKLYLLVPCPAVTPCREID